MANHTIVTVDGIEYMAIVHGQKVFILIREGTGTKHLARGRWHNGRLVGLDPPIDESVKDTLEEWLIVDGMSPSKDTENE